MQKIYILWLTRWKTCAVFIITDFRTLTGAVFFASFSKMERVTSCQFIPKHDHSLNINRRLKNRIKNLSLSLSLSLSIYIYIYNSINLLISLFLYISLANFSFFFLSFTSFTASPDPSSLAVTDPRRWITAQWILSHTFTGVDTVWPESIISAICTINRNGNKDLWIC